MASRNAKLRATAALALALAGGIDVLFGDRRTAPTPPQAAAVSAEIADVASDTVLQRLFEQANANLQATVAKIKSGEEGQVDTQKLHRDIANLDAQLTIEMGKPAGGDPRARSRLIQQITDIRTRLHALDADAEFLVSYARMHQDKLRNMQRMYRSQPNLVSFCSAMTGYINTQLRAPPAHHRNWPVLLLTLHGDTIDGLIAMVDSQTPQATTPGDKAALTHMLNTYPEVMARVPALRRLIEKKLR